MADLYLMLSTLCTERDDDDSLRKLFQQSINRAAEEDFPDLAKEMGLMKLDPNDIENKIVQPAQEDKVC